MKPANTFFTVWTAVLLLLPVTGTAQTQIDTIYSTPSLDGQISLYERLNEKYATTIYDGITAGDHYNFCEGVMALSRAYLDFDLSTLSDSCRVINATFWIYQEMVHGNSNEGVYPIWDIPGGDTLLCMVDHITYGDILDTLDWSAGDVGDPQTLHPKIGIISQDTTLEYKTMNVTEYVRYDLNSDRGRSQFRIAFDIQESDDGNNDFIGFWAGEQLLWDGYPPYLIITYDQNTGVEENSDTRPSRLHLYQNYPNPFNLETIIRYELPISGFIRLQVFDIGGREVKRLVDGKQSAGFYRVLFSADDLASGIYFCRLTLITNKKQPLINTQKITLIK